MTRVVKVGGNRADDAGWMRDVAAGIAASALPTVLVHGGGRDVTEHSLLLSTGLSFQMLENLSLDARYTYSILQSDDSLREFSRNNVSLGVTASF